MNKFERALIVTHIAYRREPPRLPIEGPYSTLARSLSRVVPMVETLGLPLEGFDQEVWYGTEAQSKKIKVPPVLGVWLPAKFIFDLLITTIAVFFWSVANWGKRKIIIGIDPLSCLPLWILKDFLGYTLVFHCVDFNLKRFDNWGLQRLYELADKWATYKSDQTWVICEALKVYKKMRFQKEAYYLPNSVNFDSEIYNQGKGARTGNKMVWTGSVMTSRQFDILFNVFSTIQTKVNSNIQFVIAPTRDHGKFKKYVTKYKLKKTKILKLTSRREFQGEAARCDVGIALYDDKFGSTQFIEPMKIWDFLLCGLPFIVSSEPSISKPIVRSKVAYFMNPKNQIPEIKSLKSFLSPINLSKKSKACLNLAKKYDFDKQVKLRIKMLLSNIPNKV